MASTFARSGAANRDAPSIDRDAYREQKIAELNEMYDMHEDCIVAAFADEASYRGYLDFQAGFLDYSAGNTLLIREQFPDAMFVASYEDWKQLGRAVARGEAGIRILIPHAYEAEIEGRLQRRVKYRVGRVFDVKQTRGRELPKPAMPSMNANLLNALVKASPVKVGIDAGIPKDTPAIYVPERRTILARKDATVPDTFRSLALAVASAQADIAKSDVRKNDLVVQSAAYLVCTRYGVDTGVFRFENPVDHVHGDEIADFRAALDAARGMAGDVVQRMDKALGLAPPQRGVQSRNDVQR